MNVPQAYQMPLSSPRSSSSASRSSVFISSLRVDENRDHGSGLRMIPPLKGIPFSSRNRQSVIARYSPRDVRDMKGGRPSSSPHCITPRSGHEWSRGEATDIVEAASEAIRIRLAYHKIQVRNIYCQAIRYGSCEPS